MGACAEGAEVMVFKYRWSDLCGWNLAGEPMYTQVVDLFGRWADCDARLRVDTANETGSEPPQKARHCVRAGHKHGAVFRQRRRRF